MTKKSISSLLIAILAIFFVFVISVSAISQPCDALTLYPEYSETYVNAAITSTKKYCTGVVYSDSQRNVYFRMRYKTGTLNYTTDKQYLVSHLSSDNWFYDYESTKFSSKKYWRFELDNYGVGTLNGFAQGWFWGQ